MPLMTIQMLMARLLYEILEGHIQDVTRRMLLTLHPNELPNGDYRHLVGYVCGSSEDGDELARDLVDELRILCIERMAA
jgi:hypothetical protein